MRELRCLLQPAISSHQRFENVFTAVCTDAGKEVARSKKVMDNDGKEYTLFLAPKPVKGKALDKTKMFRSEFKEIMADVRQPHHDDYYMVRWLRARSWDLPKAEEMLRKHLQWRIKHDVDNIEAYEAPPVLRQYFPGGILGYTFDNTPVWITTTGGLDMRGMILSVKRTDIIKYNIQVIERMCRLMNEQSVRLNKRVDKVIVIDDFEGFTMRKLMQPGMDCVLTLLAVIEANYPELLKVCYVINAPRWWSIIFNFCKPFLSDDTKRKMYILGSDWREKILQEIDADQLPERWGGTQTPEVMGTFINEICIGGDVPSTYYLKDQMLIDPATCTNTTVYPGTRLSLQFQVTEPNSILKWVFKTEVHDIGFGVSFVAGDTKLNVPETDADGLVVRSQKMANGQVEVEVVPVSRVNCHQLPEDGFVECPQCGTYTVHFCNRHSWLTSKRLQYQIQVISPDAAISEKPGAVVDYSCSNDTVEEAQS